MAKTYNKKGKKKGAKGGYSDRLLILAGDFAKVEKGIKNPNSQIYERYHSALENKKKTAKKPLF